MIAYEVVMNLAVSPAKLFVKVVVYELYIQWPKAVNDEHYTIWPRQRDCSNMDVVHHVVGLLHWQCAHVPSMPAAQHLMCSLVIRNCGS